VGLIYIYIYIHITNIYICVCVDPTQEANGNVSEMTKKIARIGSDGRHPSNCKRDLMSALALPVVAWHFHYP
jgi:hypothetical protein